jgi:hypothetical protein
MEQMLTLLIPQWYQNWPILTVCLGTGTLAFLTTRLVLRPRTCSVAPDPGDPELPSTSDRRSDRRRSGNPVSVELCDPAGKIDPLSAWVSDRSRGGLGLTVDYDVPIGTLLEVRPRQNQYINPIQIRVCSSRQCRGGYILGCQFVQTPPWNVLVLFG